MHTPNVAEEQTVCVGCVCVHSIVYAGVGKKQGSTCKTGVFEDYMYVFTNL